MKVGQVNPAVLCGECGCAMVLRMSTKFGKARLFYGCQHWPQCDGVIGAHADGKPLGTPADKETRLARIAAHAAFDPIWKDGWLTRYQAYGFLRRQLGLERDDCHMAMFDRQQCARVVEACERFFAEPGPFLAAAGRKGGKEAAA